MIVDKYGRVAGSIDLATLAQMYAETDDDDLRDHYRQVAYENGSDLGEPEPEPYPDTSGAVEELERLSELADDIDALRAEAEGLGVKVDKRWGADRLRDEIAATESDDSEE